MLIELSLHFLVTSLFSFTKHLHVQSEIVLDLISSSCRYSYNLSSNGISIKSNAHKSQCSIVNFNFAITKSSFFNLDNAITFKHLIKAVTPCRLHVGQRIRAMNICIYVCLQHTLDSRLALEEHPIDLSRPWNNSISALYIHIFMVEGRILIYLTIDKSSVRISWQHDQSKV